MGMDLCQLGIGEMLGTDLLDIARHTVEAQLLVLVDVRCGQSPTRCAYPELGRSTSAKSTSRLWCTADP